MALTVTATASGAGSANGIEIAPLVYTGASLTQNGATAASEAVTAPELAITPGHSGSVVVGAVGTGASGTAFSSPAGSITSVANSSVVSGSNWGVYRSGSTTTSPTTYGWAAPTESSGAIYIAQAEILGSPVLDASTPAVASTSSAKTITSASFTPPAGAVLVVAVIAEWAGSGAVTVALSDSASAYTWTQLSGTGATDLVSVWAGIPKTATPSPFSPPPKAARGRPALRKSRLAASPGSPVTASAPASGGYLLAQDGGHLLAQGGGHLLAQGGSPAAPSPFAPPPKVTRGRPAAARSRLRSSPGSPAVLAALAAPFAPPVTVRRGKAAARKARLASSPGSPAVPPPAAPSPFAAPPRPARGKPSARKARLSASQGSPVALPAPATPSPFSPPAAILRARAAVRKARLLSSPGSPAVPPAVAPFAVPAVVRRGRPSARKARLASSPGSPAFIPRAPSPFALPAVLKRGKAAARRSRLAGSAGSPVTLPPPPPPAVFPAVPLDLECQLNLGGTWTDVTTYAYQREGTSPPVSITRGRPDESSQANPATCSWEWNNRDGRFSPKNPLSPYYGQLGRNTPVRWSVPAQSSHLRLENDDADRAAIVEASRLDIAGSIEMRIALRLTDWRACIVACKWDGGACWLWYLNDDGTMQFTWWDGSATWRATTTQPLPHAGGDFALRVTMSAGSGTVTFYAAPGSSVDPGAWAQLGSAVSPTGGASTSIATAASPVVVGWSASFAGQLCGRVYEYRLYNSGGTVVADPVFTAQAAGATSFSDAQGNDWLVQGGAEISGRDYRFHGEMSSQPPKWDVTGKDMSVMAQAGGPLRRLGQGTANAMSAMKRAILLQSGAFAPAAYWPMEDAAGASLFGSALGGAPMTFDASPAPTLATDSSFTASAPLPSLNGSRLLGNVAPYAGTGTWTARFLLKVSPPSADATLIRIVAPSGQCPVIYVNVDTGGNLEFIGYAPDGSEAFNTGYVNYEADGNPLWVSVEALPASGGGTEYNLVTVAPGASSGFQNPQVVSGSLGSGNVTQVGVNPAAGVGDTVIGHLQVQTAWQSLFAFGQPLNAWAGEAAATRYARLAGENGYQVRIIGSPAYSAAMGPQGVDTLSDLLEECEAADLGQQLEPRQQLALGYRTLASMCAQAPALSLDYSASQPGGASGDGSDSGLDPVYDDALTKNDWTVTRGSSTGSQGATWQAQLDDGSAMSISDPPAGVGDYADTATVNVESDAQLPDVAGQLVRVGTVDEARWPVIPLNLARAEMAALYWAALDLDVGDMVEVTDVPGQVTYDPVRQLMYGTKEDLGGFHYAQEHNAVPESPYEVIILDDPVYGRVDTDGSALHAAVSSSATTLQVDTAFGFPLWTTAAADFPFDVAIAGERVTVTNVTGSSSPQSFTVTRAVNGVSKPQSAGADVRLWFAPVLALT